jgi:hypothetical protein
MRLWVRRTLAVQLVSAIILIVVESASAQGTLAGARELYAAAAYDDALTMLNSLQSSDRRPEDGRAINEYRALCLLALGRTDEATTAIQTMVTAVPSYHPSEADVSPRVRAAFRDVRQRILPGIIQQKYADAKAAFDRKNLAAASDGFRLVLELLNDPDVGAAANQPPLSQLRPLAASFRDLAMAAASATASSTPPRASAAPVAATATVVAAPTVSQRQAPTHIYTWSDPNVVPPEVMRQVMPLLGDVFVQRQGTVEIVINEAGLVETATMTVPVNAVYNGLVLAAAKSWRYKPATINGAPVKFKNSIQLDLKRR